MKWTRTVILCLVSVLFWTCEEKAPVEVTQLELDEPDSPPTIISSSLTDGDDFSVGYYNGNIRTDRAKIEWAASSDDNFLCYKVFRAAGGYGGDTSEGFESGSLPSGWSEYGDYGGWYVTDEDAADGNYSIRSYSGYYGNEYVQVTLNVPQYSNIFISFWSKGVSDGDGYLYINGSEYLHWGYDWYGEYWQYFSTYYYMGSNTQITLQWLYSTENYGYGFLDNVVVSGVAGGEPSFALLETLNDKNSTTLWDSTVTQNQYYIYKIASLVETGVPKVDDIEIKTPLWLAPDNLTVEGLSPTVVECNWQDNTESETAFKIYIDTLDVLYWDYVTVDSTTANKDDTAKVISDLSTSAQYRFSVKATNSWEDDTPLAYSASFTFSFDGPSNLAASQVAGTKAVLLTWYDNSTLENGFAIERKSETGDFAQIATVDANVASYTDYDSTNFEYGQTYIYRVRAYNDYSGMIYTDYSNEASVTISELAGIYVDFEDGQIPSGWSTYGYNGWYVTSEDAYGGNYSARCYSSYYNYEYLEATIDVPQYTYITISYYGKGYNDGDGYLYINGSQYDHWGYDYYGYSWSERTISYYTGSNSEITLLWRYDTENYGHGYLDNIQATW